MDFDFGQSTIVDTLDKVPEQFKAMYAEEEKEGEKTGKFTLKQAGDVKGAVEAILGLNTALKAARTEAKSKAPAVDLSLLKDYGASVEEIAAGFKTKVDELQQQVASTADAKVNLEKIKQDLAAGHAKELNAEQREKEALKTQLYDLLVDTTAQSKLSGRAIDPDLVMPHLRKHVKPVAEDGKFQVFIVDDAGDRRYSATTGQPMTIAEKVDEMESSDKYAPLFKSKVKSGSGQPPGASNRAASDKAFASKTAFEKINAGLAELKK